MSEDNNKKSGIGEVFETLGKKLAGYLIWTAILCVVFVILMKVIVNKIKIDADASIPQPWEVSVDFDEVEFGEYTSERKLVVYEQDLSVATTVTQAGFLSLEALTKKSVVIFKGMGNYTLDLSRISRDDIEVDAADHTITVYIPKPYPDVEALPEKTQVANENGLLAFSELRLSLSEATNLEKKGKALLLQEFNANEKARANAEQFATDAVEELLQPFADACVKNAVKDADDPFAIAPHYTVKAKIRND